jgi:hypothetical protein
MARGKSKQNVTAALRDRWIEQWETSITKKNKYIPFIDPRDIKSEGSKARIPDFENDGQDKRVLSNNEHLFAYLLMFDSNILWSKEQYPLLPLMRSRAVAKHLELRHPMYPGTNVHAVMTTDFYCKKIDGTEVAYSIKDDDQLKKLSERKRKNIENKEKIQRAFWESKGVNYHLIYSSELKKSYFARNLEKFSSNLDIPFELDLVLKRWLKNFEKNIISFGDGRLSKLIGMTSECTGIDYSEGVSLFQHCLWHKKITANLSIPIRYEHSASAFNLKVEQHD